MNRNIFALLFTLVIASCSQEGQDEDKTGQFGSSNVEELRTDTADFDYEKRLEELNERIKTDKDNANLWHERAYVHFHEGKTEKAIDDVRKAIGLAPNVAAYYFTKGFFFHAQLKLEEARTAFEQAIERDPDMKEANLFLAKIQLALRNHDEAYSHVNAALESDEFYAEAYRIKAMIHLDRVNARDSVRAANTFKTALELDPNNVEVLNQLGLLHSGWGDMLAVDYFESALEVQPNNALVWYNLGKFYQDMGEKTGNSDFFDMAENSYRQLMAVDSSDYRPYYNLGYLYLEYSDEYDKASSFFVEAVKRNPGPRLKYAYFNLGLAHERKGDRERAAEFYQMALDIDPQYDDAAMGKGRVLR